MLSMLAATFLAIGLAIGMSSAPPEPAAAADANAEPLTPAPGITIQRDGDRPWTVEIQAWTCLEAGFLEQVACSPGTREHESLVVVRAKPSDIHAALLVAGYEAGRPGQWIYHEEIEKIELIPPQGAEVDVWVRYVRDDETIEEPVRNWIRDHHRKREFPAKPWIFGGSLFRENPAFMGPGEHYVADMTGSIIGLVTFGDEVIGYRQVISDQAAIHEPEWEVNTDRIPAEGTEVTIIIRPWSEADADDDETGA